MTQWEYATLYWTENRTSFNHPAGTGWKWEQKFELWWPGADKSEIIGKSVHIWNPGNKPDELDSVAEGITKLSGVLNTLGAEGWELISETVRSTAVNSGDGYAATGRPVSFSYLFKRCIN